VPPAAPEDKSPTAPKDKSTCKDVVALILDVARGEFDKEESLPEETEGESQAGTTLKRVKMVKGKSPTHTSPLKKEKIGVESSGARFPGGMHQTCFALLYILPFLIFVIHREFLVFLMHPTTR